MKRVFILVFLILASTSYALSNPASVYCERQGGKLELEKERLGWVGICVFPDHSCCEEWSYFRKACSPGRFFIREKHCRARGR